MVKYNFFNFFMDVGLVGWISLIFGILIIILGDWSNLLGFIAFYHGWERLNRVLDRHRLIEEIRKC